MEWLWWVGGAAVVLIAIDRVFTALEDRGHMFWRRPRPRAGLGSPAAGGALGGLIEVFQPNHQYLVAYLRPRRTPTDAAPKD
jgi:hypothetical protein